MKNYLSKLKNKFGKNNTPPNNNAFQNFLYVLIAMVVSGGSQKLQANSIELIYGQKDQTKNWTLDQKITTDVGPVNIFLRNKIKGEQGKDDVNYFGIVDLTYPLNQGIEIVGEAQLIQGVGIDYRIGLSIFKQAGDFSIFSVGTASTKTPGNIELLTDSNYEIQLTKDQYINLGLETVTNMTYEDLNFSTEKLSIMFSPNEGTFSFGPNVTVSKSNIAPTYNVGASAKLKF